MSWNRPSEGKIEGKTGGGRRNVHLRGLVAGVLVVCGAALAWWMLSGDSASETRPEEVRAKRIKEVTPAPAPTNKVQKAARDPNKVYWRGQEYPMYDARGGKAYITGYGVRYHTPHVITNTSSAARRETWETKPFKRYTDKTIAVLLYTEPGTSFVGTIPYDKKFTEQFLKSLDEPIEILPDDTDEVKQLKQDVIATRADLKARHDAGEDIAKIMNDAREELRQLGAYKDEIQAQVTKLAREGKFTEKDLDDLEAAANEMLVNRGCSKMKMPEFLRRGAKLRALREQAKELQKGN